MATFLMIHGAWHGGWCFDALRAPLAARGHVMRAPTLPGMGGTAAEVAAVSLERWAAFAVEVAREQAGPVILCGHSRGGIVASQAAERAPEMFAALVYVAAFMVPDGMSMIAARDAWAPNADLEAGLSAAARGGALALSREAAAAAFYQDCPPEAREAALARIMPEPILPLSTPLALTPARFGSVARHYIECLADAAIPIAGQRAMQAALPCASVTTLESGHSPFMTMPDRLAGALNIIAERIDT